MAFNKEKSVSISSSNGTIYDKYNTNEYIGYLIIPNIDMNLGFYDYESPLNDVEYNIELIKTPIEDTYLLAGHSGTGAKALFNDLHNLTIGANVYLKIDDIQIHYVISDIYRVEKIGSIKLKNIPGMLYLTTCDQIIKGYQLVIEGSKV